MLAKWTPTRDADEARAYLEHAMLGPRLLESCDVLLSARGVSTRDIFGEIDALKLRSCLTLFEGPLPNPGEKLSC